MNCDETTNYVAGTLERLLAEGRAGRGRNVGSRLDREEREARDLVRLLQLVESLRSQTATP